MSQDQVRQAIDALRARLQAELDTQLSALTQRQDEAIEAARRTAQNEAEQEWAVRVEAMKAEWTARLDAEVKAVREESERRVQAESARLRAEAEQAATESAGRVRAEIEQAVAAQHQQATAALQGDRDRLESDRRSVEAERRQLDADRTSLDADRTALNADRTALNAERTDLNAARAALDAERHATLAAEHGGAAAVQRLLAAFRQIDEGRSLSEALTALLAAASAEVRRAAIFVANGSEFQGWKAAGFQGDGPIGQRLPADGAGLFGEVFRRAEAVTTASGRTAPAFASLPSDRSALAVPLIVGGVVVAVLYADDVGMEEGGRAAWVETVQLLGRHAAARLGQLTAVRTAQAMGISTAAPASVAAGNGEEDNAARRYARLLVSEIKLYNEGAVRVGREKRDLLHRLRAEIERAQRLYEERIPATEGSRRAYFQQELVQTLADGDPALLGGSA